MQKSRKKLFLAVAGTLAIGSYAMAQIDLGSVIKVGGVVAVVSAFGKDINNAINKLTKHKDSRTLKTKVVPILSVGIGQSSAVGAAQISGPPSRVDQVVAVAQPEASILGNQVRVRGLIPVSSKDVVKEIKVVGGVGVTGLVDIRL
jgi:hypothetical protein